MRNATEFLSSKGIMSNKDAINVPQTKIWLEEYAKETSIEFFKWNSKRENYPADLLTPEERYKLFIKSIENGKEKI